MERIDFSQLEHLQAKYTGTGHSGTSAREWLETQHKDTAAAFVGHPHLAKYVAVATGECAARARLAALEGSLAPLYRQADSEPALR